MFHWWGRVLPTFYLQGRTGPAGSVRVPGLLPGSRRNSFSLGGHWGRFLGPIQGITRRIPTHRKYFKGTNRPRLGDLASTKRSMFTRSPRPILSATTDPFRLVFFFEARGSTPSAQPDLGASIRRIALTSEMASPSGSTIKPPSRKTRRR